MAGKYEKVETDEEMKKIDMEIEELTQTPSPSTPFLVFLFALNIAASVGIVMMNKW